MNVAICVATCKRPIMLGRLLEGIGRLMFRDRQPQIRIIIVDNDAEGSARQVCEDWRMKLRWPLDYLVEPQRGIPFARNKALDSLGGTADWIAFIDDDETPSPGWLDELIRVQREFDADVVAGPVVPHFSEPAPPWVVAGRFFEPRRYATGTRLPHTFTGNVLVRLEAVRRLGLRFDERLGLMGGDDRHFFQQLGMAGCKIVFANEAIATECVPASRTNAKWLMQRYLRAANSTAYIELDLRPKWRVWPLLMAKGGAWLVIGAGQILAGLVVGKHLSVRGLCSAAYAVGLLTGCLGWRYEEYRRTHGN